MRYVTWKSDSDKVSLTHVLSNDGRLTVCGRTVPAPYAVATVWYTDEGERVCKVCLSRPTST